MTTFPTQLEQAAGVDSETQFQAFLLIVMPLSAPGIIATSIYSFIGAWNEYIFAYTFLNKNDQLTLAGWNSTFLLREHDGFPWPHGGELHDEPAGESCSSSCCNAISYVPSRKALSSRDMSGGPADPRFSQGVRWPRSS